MPSSGRQGVHALGPRLPYHTEARRLLAPYTLVTSDTYRLQLSPHRSPLDKNEQKLNFFFILSNRSQSHAAHKTSWLRSCGVINGWGSIKYGVIPPFLLPPSFLQEVK